MKTTLPGERRVATIASNRLGHCPVWGTAGCSLAAAAAGCMPQQVEPPDDVHELPEPLVSAGDGVSLTGAESLRYTTPTVPAMASTRIATTPPTILIAMLGTPIRMNEVQPWQFS